MLHQMLRLQLQRDQQGRVFGQRLGGDDGRQACGDFLLAAAVVRIEEAPHGRWSGGLHLGQVGPAPQEIQRQRRGQVFPHQRQRQGVIALERRAQAVAPGAALLDERAPGLDQEAQLPGRLVLNHQGAQPVGVEEDQFAEPIGVPGIVLGPADVEGAPVIGQAARVDRIEGEEVVLQQAVKYGATTLFEGHGDPARRVLPAQLAGPGVQRLGGMFDQVRFGWGRRGGAHDQAVFLVGPVQADPAGDGGCRRGAGHRGRGRRSLDY